MACRFESREIDEKTYTVQQWNATKALTMKLKLTKVFGPTFAMLFQKQGSDIDLSGALGALFEGRSVEDIVSLMTSCIDGVAVGDSRITTVNFDQYFDADNLMTIYKVFLFVIEVNYSKSFGQWAEKIKGSLAKVQL